MKNHTCLRFIVNLQEEKSQDSNIEIEFWPSRRQCQARSIQKDGSIQTDPVMDMGKVIEHLRTAFKPPEQEPMPQSVITWRQLSKEAPTLNGDFLCAIETHKELPYDFEPNLLVLECSHWDGEWTANEDGRPLEPNRIVYWSEMPTIARPKDR